MYIAYLTVHVLYEVDVQYLKKKNSMILIATWYLSTLFIWIMDISFGVYVWLIICLDMEDAFSLGISEVI